MSSIELSSCCSCYVFSQWFAYFFLIKLACVASVSARLRQESWDRSKKNEWQGRGRGKKDPLLSSPSPFHLFFGTRSNFRAITGLETLATQAIIKRVKCFTIWYSLPKQLNLVPRSSRLTVQFSGNYAAQLTSFFTYAKILPNLVDCSWLWWIMLWDFSQSGTEKYFE